jgi:D-xylose transport system permease protein
MKSLNIFDKIKFNVKTYTLIIALLIIWLLFGSLTGWIFFSPRNLSNLFRQMTIVSFLSIGMTLIIITGNIDLSVGSLTGLISAIAAYLQADMLPPLLSQLFPNLSIVASGILSTVITIIICLLAGLLIGVYQGYIIAYLKVPAFIVTLGGMLVFRGGVLGITQGKTVVPIENSLRWIAQGYLSKNLGMLVAVIAVIVIFLMSLQNRKKKIQYGFELKPLAYDLLTAAVYSVLVFGSILIVNDYRGIQNPVIIMIVIAIMIAYLSNNTRFGRYVYALGGNIEATKLSGINVQSVIFKVFILMGLLSGVAGIVLTGYVAAGTIGGGTNYELSAIAGCVIGGVSLMGGSGTIIGALIGALIMASLENGMSVMNMGVFWQYIVKGLVLVLAVYVDIASKKNNS